MQCDQHRKRMEQADLRFLSEPPIDFPDDALTVADEVRDVMRAAVADRIPAMVPDVVDEDVETIDEARPEGIVGIDREPVPVAQNEARSVRVTVSADEDGSTVGRARLGIRQAAPGHPSVREGSSCHLRNTSPHGMSQQLSHGVSPCMAPNVEAAAETTGGPLRFRQSLRPPTINSVWLPPHHLVVRAQHPVNIESRPGSLSPGLADTAQIEQPYP